MDSEEFIKLIDKLGLQGAKVRVVRDSYVQMETDARRYAEENKQLRADAIRADFGLRKALREAGESRDGEKLEETFVRLYEELSMFRAVSAAFAPPAEGESGLDALTRYARDKETAAEVQAHEAAVAHAEAIFDPSGTTNVFAEAAQKLEASLTPKEIEAAEKLSGADIRQGLFAGETADPASLADADES